MYEKNMPLVFDRHFEIQHFFDCNVWLETLDVVTIEDFSYFVSNTHTKAKMMPTAKDKTELEN